MSSGKKKPGYQPLPTSESTNVEDHVLDFKSPFTYSKPPNDYSVFMDYERQEENYKSQQSFLIKILSHFLTVISYTIFILGFPVLYWVCIKRLGPNERMVVFRLGKMIGSKGPGKVLVFPWLDRIQKVNVSDSAFSVPPQQLITSDGGIIEIGAEIQYGVTDVGVMVREVADHQDILRSLGKTVLVRLLAKKQISKLKKEKTICATEIRSELNRQVHKWGLDVRCVSLSEPKVLKQPESNPGLGPLLSSLGVQGDSGKSEKPYPSPMEFARNAFTPSANPATGQPQENTDNTPQDITDVVEKAEAGEIDWRSCIETVMSHESFVEEDVFGTYGLHISQNGKDKITDIIIDIGPNGTLARYQTDGDNGNNTDVTVNITSSDLAGVLKGSLPPLQAYLTGRISTSGDVRKLMLFDKLSNRSHKPGTTFNL